MVISDEEFQSDGELVGCADTQCLEDSRWLDDEVRQAIPSGAWNSPVVYRPHLSVEMICSFIKIYQCT